MRIKTCARSMSGDILTSEHELEVEPVANAAGRVVILPGLTVGSSDIVKVEIEIAGYPQIASQIRETTVQLHPGDHQGAPALVGNASKRQGGRSVPIGIRVTEDRPLIRNLYDSAKVILDAQESVRKDMLAADEAEYLAAARAQIPAGCVEVTFRRSEGDGWVEIYTDAQGRELRSPKIAGSAGRIAWMTAEDYSQAVGQHALAEAAEHARKAGQARAREQLKTAIVPAEAVSAYRAHRGDAEAAWEAGDATGCMLIRRWADAIEAQGL